MSKSSAYFAFLCLVMTIIGNSHITYSVLQRDVSKKTPQHTEQLKKKAFKKKKSPTPPHEEDEESSQSEPEEEEKEISVSPPHKIKRSKQVNVLSFRILFVPLAYSVCLLITLFKFPSFILTYSIILML